MRTLITLLALASAALAAPPAGSWKLTLPSQQPLTLLVAFSEADGKWTAKVVDVTAKLRDKPKFTEVTVNGDAVKFSLLLNGESTLSFDGIAAKDGKTLKGSLSFGGDLLLPVELSPSTLKNLDDIFEMAKEGLNQTEDADAVYENAREVLRQATAKKLPPEEARAILDRVGKIAAGSGRRWERYTTLKLADIMAGQDGFADVALAQARKAERLLTDDDDLTVRMNTLETLVRSLQAAKKADEAKRYETQLQKLVAREWLDFAKANPAFKVDEFKGRKGKSDRVVLVECFSGTKFEPSAAIDAARDGLLKMYKPTDVIVLTYQLPLNGDQNPMLVPESLERIRQYTEQVRAGQHALVSGKKSIGIKGETRVKDAESIFTTLRDRINEELEQPAKVKLTLSVTPVKDGYTAKATVTDLEKPADTMSLRFVLAEERIRWPALNGTKFHQMVVRSFPGGTKGFPLTKPTAEQTVTINLAEIKAALAKTLGELSAEGEPLPVAKLAALKNLRLIAFVQNDATNEILTAADVELK